MPLRTGELSNNSSNFNDVPSSLNAETLSSELPSACSGSRVIRNTLWEFPEKNKQGACRDMRGPVALGLTLSWSDVPLIPAGIHADVASSDPDHIECQLAVPLLVLIPSAFIPLS